MTVYLVFSIQGDIDELEGIFSSKQRAEGYILSCETIEDYEGVHMYVVPEKIDRYDPALSRV